MAAAWQEGGQEALGTLVWRGRYEKQRERRRHRWKLEERRKIRTARREEIEGATKGGGRNKEEHVNKREEQRQARRGSRKENMRYQRA